MALSQLKGLPKYLERRRIVRCLSLATRLRKDALPPIEPFVKRHIGPLEKDVIEMLQVVGVKSMEELIDKTVPESIRLKEPLKLDNPMSEYELIEQIKELAQQNRVTRSYVGHGYYNCIVPPVIARNILENPGWITQYTPYQPELSQGRLESLMNYQTMVVDMTGLDIANASLLDEPTAAAEAMGLCYRHAKMKKHTFFVDQNCYTQSIAVVKTRAKFLGIEVIVGDFQDLTLTEDNDVCGILVQYPNNEGHIVDYTTFIKRANDVNIPVAMCTDLLSLTMLKSPGELGASIALGSCQRLGVPMGCGGPHAAFFAVKDDLKKMLPGRIVGSTWDNDGRPTFRLALQAREQHIRRDKATSNICTSQALLANMSAMYTVYHGPTGLKDIAKRVHRAACLFAQGVSGCGHTVPSSFFFDTVKVTLSDKVSAEDVKRRANEKEIDIYHFEDGVSFSVAFDETVRSHDINDLFYVFGCDVTVDDIADSTRSYIEGTDLERTSQYLQHPVFNSYHSETDIVRYMKRLENRDVSLAHSMTPLGSCTMKLNPTTALLPLSLPQFNSLHPYGPESHAQGYKQMLSELEQCLCEITGYDKFSFQPNSGAQGEYAGLCTILAYLKDKGETHRNICLIPESAHGTNPASAMMAGLKVVVVPTNKQGVVSTEDFRAKIEEHGKNLAAVMITYPSTYGVFEDTVTEVCDMIHHYGGQVYVDGANMNAQVGLCRPGDYGGDVSHLNLHKTFCIPHGGGGPGMGPIGVKAHLAPYLPIHPLTGPRSEKSFGTVSAAEWGSASILPISWAYIKLMGLQGLTRASQVAILNANYMSALLKDHYNILFRGKHGFNAHEFILDARVFKASSGIESADITKRLQDYGFHAPTLSWPVSNTLMIEPTESESRAEMDRYCDALISIRQEIREVEEGKYDRMSNVLKNAPHTMGALTSSHWPHPYSREKAAFPAPWLTTATKRWPCSARANDVHGDKNVVATLYQKLVSLKK